MQYLGLGADGHIGFAEPGTPFGKTAFTFTFPEEFRDSRIPMFGCLEKVPHTGMTLGIQDCMGSREIVLAVNSADKAEVVRRIIHGPVTEEVPASALRLHPAATLVLSECAAARL